MTPLPFLRLARWEMRRLVAERTGLALIALWCGLLVLAATHGARQTRARHAEIAAAEAVDYKAWKTKRAELAAIEGGFTQPAAFRDPRSPTNSVMGRSGERPVALVPAPLAAIAVGTGDLSPPVLPTGMITKLHSPAQSIENPANRLAGPLDLTFVVGTLLPLFVLALAFDVLARERDARIWPLLASQPTSPRRIVAARLLLHFGALWLPLVLATTLAVGASRSGAASFPSVIGEIALWLAFAAAYLVFWQLLAAAVNFCAGSAATNAVLLAGAWLASVLLLPSAIDAAVQSVAPPPDRRAFLLEVRATETDLFKRAEELRDAYYAAHPDQRPTTALNEYDTYYVQNLYPRALAADTALASAFATLEEERSAQAAWWRRLAWLSPTLAFRLATEQLAGVTPLQRGALLQEARRFQTELRAHFGAKLASMTPLTLADYDRAPSPTQISAGFGDRLRVAGPSLAGVFGATLAMGLILRRSRPSTA